MVKEDYIEEIIGKGRDRRCKKFKQLVTCFALVSGT